MNYTTLVANIQNFLEDDSSELQSSIDQIIDQAEVMIFQRLPNLPCFRKTATANMVAGTSDYTVPTARMIRQVSVISSRVSAMSSSWKHVIQCLCYIGGDGFDRLIRINNVKTFGVGSSPL